MKKKTRNQAYDTDERSKMAKPMKKQMPIMDDLDSMDDMEDMEEYEGMECMDDMECMDSDYMEEVEYKKGAHTTEKMDKMMCDKMPDSMVLAHAYVPWQYYESAFTPAEALMRGTLFPELWGVYKIPK